MNEYRSVNRYLNKKDNLKVSSYENKRWILNFIHKGLISGLLLITIMCIIKIYPDTKQVVYKYVYQDSFSFAKINDVYKKYLGSFLPLDDILKDPTQTVFDEKLVYQSEEKYNEGVKLTVDKNYLMPVLESGIVVFIGNKDNYGKTVIVQQVDGVDLWYINVKSDSIKLYDYVEKGSLLGECLDSEVYLYYQKSGEFLDYKKYLP